MMKLYLDKALKIIIISINNTKKSTFNFCNMHLIIIFVTLKNQHYSGSIMYEIRHDLIHHDIYGAANVTVRVISPTVSPPNVKNCKKSSKLVVWLSW